MSDEEGADVSPETEEKVVEAEAKATETESVTDAESPPAVEEDDVKKTDSSIQTRIDKLTRNFRQEQRTSADKDRRIEELEKQLSDVPRQPTKSLKDFDFDEDKYREYLFDETASRAESAALKVVAESKDETRDITSEQEFTRRERTFAATVEDYDATVHVYDGSLQISPLMADEIQDSEIGPEMAYHLGKNPDISAEIARLPERTAIRRMTLLESELKVAKAKAAKKVSDAPPPVPKIPSGEQSLDKDPAKMSDKEFAAMRRKQIANR